LLLGSWLVKLWRWAGGWYKQTQVKFGNIQCSVCAGLSLARFATASNALQQHKSYLGRALGH
jgi:hypothetical protein